MPEKEMIGATSKKNAARGDRGPSFLAIDFGHTNSGCKSSPRKKSADPFEPADSPVMSPPFIIM